MYEISAARHGPDSGHLGIGALPTPTLMIRILSCSPQIRDDRLAPLRSWATHLQVFVFVGLQFRCMPCVDDNNTRPAQKLWRWAQRCLGRAK
jgi:hypothetical protein